MKPIKKNRLLTAVCILTLAFCFSGCSMPGDLFAKEPEMYATAGSIKMYDSDSMDSMLIDVNGRTYAPYGVVKKSMSNRSLRECVGYIDDDKDRRVYTLEEDPFDNYLVQKTVNAFMDPPMFFRDISTIKEDIFTPYYIESLDYEEWEQSGCYADMKEFDVNILLDADDVYELSMDYKVNGVDSGTGGVRNADRSELEKGEFYGISVTEMALYGKFNKDAPFDVECYFHVETMDGEMHDLEYVYKDTVEFGDRISLTLTGNAKDGYLLK